MKKLCFSFLILFCCHSDIFSQPIVKVYGNKLADSLKTASQAYRCLELLDVDENVCICIRFSEKMPKGVHGLTFFQNTIVGLNGQTLPVYRVRINAKYRMSKQVTALAHELVHVKQYVKGELDVINGQTVIWDDQYYEYLNAADRFVSPWEREAYSLGNQLVNMLQKDTEAFPTVQQTRGERRESVTVNVLWNKSPNP